MGSEASAIPSALTFSKSSTQAEAHPSTRLFVLASSVLWPPRTPSRHRRVSAPPYRANHPIQGPPRRVSPVPLPALRTSSPLYPGGVLRGVSRGWSTVLGLRSLLPSPRHARLGLPALSVDRSIEVSSGLHFRYRPFACLPSFRRALVTPLGTEHFGPALGSATRRPRLTSAGLSPAGR